MGEFIKTTYTDEMAKRVLDGWKNNFHQQLPLDPGSGKTYISIHACALLNKNAHIFIFAPKGKATDGSWEASIESYNKVMHTNLTYSITTYRKVKIGHLYEELYKHECNILLMDEIHDIKGTTNKSATRLIDFSRNDKIYKSLGLSGTPTPNNPFNACTYLVINGMYRNQTHFRDEHVARLDKHFNPIYERESDLLNWDLYEKNMNQINTYVETEHLLPDVINHYSNIKLDNHYKYIHPIFNTEKHPFEDFEKRTTKEHYNKALWYYKNNWVESRQASLMMLIKIMAFDPSRMNVLYDLLMNKIKGETPVIIAYTYKAELAAIEKVAKRAKYDIKYVNGSIKNVGENQPPEHKRTVIALQYAAGGPGVEFTYSKYMVFYAPTYSYMMFKQAKGRNVRLGMNGPIHQFYITTRDGYDFKIWKKVHSKAATQKDIQLISFDEELQEFLDSERT